MPVLAMPLWTARGPRFLALLLGLWVLVRVASHWPGETYTADPPFSPFAQPLQQMTARGMDERRDPIVAPVLASDWPASKPARAGATPGILLQPRLTGSVTAPRDSTGHTGSQGHAWRLALRDGFDTLSTATRRTLVMPQATRIFAPGLAPLTPLPSWPDAAMARWSLAVTGYWRSGGGSTPTVGPGSAARLGGSQSTVRLSYLVDPGSRLRAYVRAAHAPDRPDGADVAVGVALRPLRAVPVDVHIERRTVVSGNGRDTTLVYAAGGIDNLRLTHDFRLSAYGQAGLADYGKVVGFADAAVAVQRDVAMHEGVRLSLGTIVAAAAQPGARRVDIGPRAVLALPDIGQGAQIALDWRERVAGNARPGSGLALTLAAEF